MYKAVPAESKRTKRFSASRFGVLVTPRIRQRRVIGISIPASSTVKLEIRKLVKMPAPNFEA
jgi:hypothetical protein